MVALQQRQALRYCSAVLTSPVPPPKRLIVEYSFHCPSKFELVMSAVPENIYVCLAGGTQRGRPRRSAPPTSQCVPAWPEARILLSSNSLFEYCSAQELERQPVPIHALLTSAVTAQNGWHPVWLQFNASMIYVAAGSLRQDADSERCLAWCRRCTSLCSGSGP